MSINAKILYQNIVKYIPVIYKKRITCHTKWDLPKEHEVSLTLKKIKVLLHINRE
jgi:hypothetical protein